MEIAVLDVGAATLNLLRARFREGELVERVEYQRWVRLGEGTLLSAVIAPDAWNSALSGIEALLACAAHHKPEQIAAVSTSVMREAANGDAFRKTLHVLYGLRVRVLSPAEEATLSFRGVQSVFTDRAAPLLVIDLGGGCVNFALGQGASYPLTATLSLGTMRLKPAFTPDGTLTKSDATALSTLIKRSMAMTAFRVPERTRLRVAFCSGAARAVRDYVVGRDTPLICTEPTAITRTALIEAERSLRDRKLESLVASGVPEEDAETLALATTTVRTIMDQLGLSQALVVDRGLRDGVALARQRDLSLDASRALS